MKIYVTNISQEKTRRIFEYWKSSLGFWLEELKFNGR